MQYLVTSSRAGVAGAAPVEAGVRRVADRGAPAWMDLEAPKHIAPTDAMQTHAIKVFCVVMVGRILGTSFPQVRGELIVGVSDICSGLDTASRASDPPRV